MDDNRTLLEALDALDPSLCTYTEWIQVGMALKSEGLPCSVWDNWSRRDSGRYVSEECERKWRSFDDSGKTNGGTIIYLAGHYNNYTPSHELDWDDGLEATYEDTIANQAKPDEKPYQMAVRFLEALFKPEETVSFVCSAKQDPRDGKWKPSNGGAVRKCADIIKDLKKHRKLDDAFGTINTEAGAWIRLNPATGPNNKDVTRYAYALAESDNLTIEEQKKLLIGFKLPIATLTESGGKSVHAAVKIDAQDANEYKQRTLFLFDWLAKHKFIVDENNKNEARLSRLAGALRGGKMQKLIATNIGCGSWLEWIDYIQGIDDNLPQIKSAWEIFENPTPDPPAVIDGILKKGAKMILTGDSKSGKTCLLMNLAVCIAEGWEWLGRKCMQGKVLYINMEVMQSDFEARFKAIYKAYGRPCSELGKDNFDFWNLRGKVEPLEKLAPKMISRCRNAGYLAIIVDPIYKVQGGDENSAEAIGRFCALFDRIAEETGASMIYAHHHAKGLQGARKAMDRGSGSGVFSRDADTIIDFVSIVLDPNEKQLIRDMKGQLDYEPTPLRMEFVLRSFQTPKPINMFFEFPLHNLDNQGLLECASVEGSAEANRKLSPNNQRSDLDKKNLIEYLFNAVARPDGTARFSDMYNHPECKASDVTLKKYVKLFPNDYVVENGIFRKL